MSRRPALATAILAALPFAAAQAQETCKIGASVGLTGYAAANDRFWRDRLGVAAEVLNAQGGVLGVYGFIAAIIGGFGSASGALAGGVLLGAIQALAIVTFGAGYKNVVALSVLLVVLLVFPNCVFGGAWRPSIERDQ